MTFEEALQEIKDNSHLLGAKIAMGTIDELVIYPNNENAKETFKDIYFQTLNAEEAIMPFIKEDVSVSAIVNKKEIKKRIFLTANKKKKKNELKK